MVKRTTAFLFFLLAIIVGVANAAKYEIDAGVIYMDWKEDLPWLKKNPTVKEYGFLYPLVGKVTFSPTEKILLRTEGEVFYGSISYSGSYFATDTCANFTGEWKGFRIAEALGYKFKIRDDFNLYPFLSIEYSSWKRGGGEAWNFVYSKLGLKAEKGNYFAEAGILLPIFTETKGSFNEIEGMNGGRFASIIVHPQGVPTPFAKIGYQYKKITIALKYLCWEWNESEKAIFGDGTFAFQPHTKSRFVGFEIGFTFY